MALYGCNSLGDCVSANNHPKWYPPQRGETPVLMINNSLTGQKEPFVPMKGKQVRWYNCGPTVYDHSHMGHARTYLTFDILRRIMEDYLNYDILYQVNITDIDDKIILRARHNELIARYIKENKPLADVLADVERACADTQTKHEAKIETLKQELVALKADDKTISKDLEDKETALKTELHKLSLIVETRQKVQAAGSDVAAVIEAARGPLAGKLDAELGSTITDHSIFDAHAREFELSYMQDMEALNIREPDVLTRVTEYVPHIITFVEKIITKGFAYESGGSVYIDLVKYKKHHDYRKLSPSNEDTSESDLAESEGALGGGNTGEKRHKNDFALWKASKPGEPAWDSPWGKGRPGWHIECSVVASDILGERIDLHSGGVDLKFPHHDNEMAQSEACFGNQQWINYFTHSGHLHIRGLKMSKSLKNFITIRQALEEHTSRQLRIMFLLQMWDKPMYYTDAEVEDAKTKEAKLKHFFGKVKALQREGYLTHPAGVGWRVKADGDALGQKSFDANNFLASKLLEAQQAVHEAILDNFNTPLALREMIDLVSETNKYMNGEARPSVPLVLKVARYITKMLKVFGVVFGFDEIGYGATQEDGADNAKTVTKYVDAFVDFRAKVRTAALEGKPIKELLQVCDDVRDGTLVDLGVRLEDRTGKASVWSLDDPAVLRKEIADKREKEREQRLAKAKNKIKLLEKELEKCNNATTLPGDLFKGMTDKYSEFDERGIPTKDHEGKELAKSALKKINQAFNKQQKLRDDVLKKSGGDIDAHIAKLTAQIEELQM